MAVAHTSRPQKGKKKNLSDDIPIERFANEQQRVLILDFHHFMNLPFRLYMLSNLLRGLLEKLKFHSNVGFRFCD